MKKKSDTPFLSRDVVFDEFVNFLFNWCLACDSEEVKMKTSSFSTNFFFQCKDNVTAVEDKISL